MSDIVEPRNDLTAEERLEVCHNRCFIRTEKAHDDLDVIGDRWEEEVSNPENWRAL